MVLYSSGHLIYLLPGAYCLINLGEEDEDHDNRKLKKADRMRLVVKNKEDGTELFK